MRGKTISAIVGLYIVAPPQHKRSARVVEQVLIRLSGHYFSLRENRSESGR